MWMKNLRREVHGNLSFFSARDEIVAVGQMDGRNFHKGLVMSVAARCKWGMPQVLKCRPFYRGRPFPTLFWLTCPHLAYQCGRLESGGGVKALEDFLQFPLCMVAALFLERLRTVLPASVFSEDLESHA